MFEFLIALISVVLTGDPSKSGNLMIVVLSRNQSKMATEQLRIGVLMEVYGQHKTISGMRLGACRKSVGYNFTSKIQLRLNLNNI